MEIEVQLMLQNRRSWNSRPGGNHALVDTLYVSSGRFV
jgi:hypothetical protein